MPFSTRNLLEKIHERVGLMIQVGSRLLATVVVLGGLFSVLTLSVTQVLEAPEALCQMQALRFNHAEFSGLTKQHDLERTSRASDSKQPTDPDWDGTLAGVSLGLTLGRSVPLIGCVLGPVAGGVIGYRMDSRISYQSRP